MVQYIDAVPNISQSSNCALSGTVVQWYFGTVPTVAQYISNVPDTSQQATSNCGLSSQYITPS